MTACPATARLAPPLDLALARPLDAVLARLPTHPPGVGAPPLDDPPPVVGPATLTRRLAHLPDRPRRPVLDPDHPLHVEARDPRLLLAHDAIALLQLTHPAVARAFDALGDPPRAARHLRAHVALMRRLDAAPIEDATTAAASLHRRRYAMRVGAARPLAEPDTLVWLAAARWHLDATLRARLDGPLDGDAAHHRHAGRRAVAPLHAVDRAQLPHTARAFDADIAARLADPAHALTRAALRVGAALLDSQPRLMRRPLRALTAALLPPRIRSAYGLDLGPATRATTRHALAALRILTPLAR